MKTFDIVFSEISNNNLHDINHYIAKELNNPQAAKSVLTEISNTIENTAMFPSSGALSGVPKLAEYGVRFKTAGNYIVFYSVNDEKQEIDVLYIKYGGSDLSKLNI